MTPANFCSLVLQPIATAAAFQNTRPSRVLLAAIAGQESNWQHRTQINGPARGYWQFDITAVINLQANRVTAAAFKAACVAWDIPLDAPTIHTALAWHDPLAYMAARLLLWADPQPLPAAGDVQGSWTYYDRVWGPGTPRPENWAAVYKQAARLVV